MSKQSPLKTVQDVHGGKEKLVDKLVGLLDAQDGESEDEFKARLKLVPNSKLLHLLTVGERAKELGGRDALVEKVAGFKGQSKDDDYKTKLGEFSLGRLIDMHDSLARRAKA